MTSLSPGVALSRRQRAPLRTLAAEQQTALMRWGRALGEPAAAIIRAKALLAMARGHSFAAAAQLAVLRSGDAVSHLVGRFRTRRMLCPGSAPPFPWCPARGPSGLGQCSRLAHDRNLGTQALARHSDGERSRRAAPRNPIVAAYRRDDLLVWSKEEAWPYPTVLLSLGTGASRRQAGWLSARVCPGDHWLQTEVRQILATLPEPRAGGFPLRRTVGRGSAGRRISPPGLRRRSASGGLPPLGGSGACTGGRSLVGTPPATVPALNADDPLVSAIREHLIARVVLAAIGANFARIMRDRSSRQLTPGLPPRVREIVIYDTETHRILERGTWRPDAAFVWR